MQTGIPFVAMRGGGSKGIYFHASDLPASDELRNAVLVAAMGGDDRQIDGLGGSDPLTSKVAVISPSSRDDADVDYLFVQVVVGKSSVDMTQNCGNILAGVAPFAIEQGIVDAAAGTTTVSVHMLNSGNLCQVDVLTPGGEVSYDGDARIDGVPGTAAPVLCNYLDVAGSATGSLLPTGSVLDHVKGVEVTCIDNGMPVVVLRAADMGITGYESRDALNADEELKARLEEIRLELGPRMKRINPISNYWRCVWMPIQEKPSGKRPSLKPRARTLRKSTAKTAMPPPPRLCRENPFMFISDTRERPVSTWKGKRSG